MKTVRKLVLILIAVMGMIGSSFADVKYEMTVAKDGSGDFTSIQEAINATKAFPDQPIVIHIQKGIYIEKVRVYSWNTKLTLKGEDANETIITYDDHFEKLNLGRNSTFHTYTLKVEANDFIAENLTIINSSGPVGQAVALHVEGDRCQFRNCRILGHQDTLYAAGEGSRQYYKDCFIEGTTDFIFGEAIAVFDNCTINSKSDSYVTAASTVENQPFGYVFLNCKLTADEGVSKCYLGRPWRDYAKVVYLNCELGGHILPEGWSNWGGTQRDQTAYYAEYQSSGAGANTEQRISWSHQLSDKEAKAYTIENIFNPGNRVKSGTDNWNPAE
ncbi:pectinesterase family protein [Mangrovibacterium diazotrophicum]|uniref:Pectinesterase n=1 Tax=Mangrovibacterium diazotrophicum TaxID=1261403 RepID=A0A419VWD8_9BACT|nr:pectinesterase family protein [Mangrovibacterium diazotrophicum]RKD86463.1 pectinesterase [Mangrovibacterium diazotrophicum]